MLVAISPPVWKGEAAAPSAPDPPLIASGLCRKLFLNAITAKLTSILMNLSWLNC